MFNRITDVLKKTSLLIVILALVISCKNEVKIDFIEQNIELLEDAEISINYPKARGTQSVADLINTTLQNYIVNQTNLTEDSLTNLTIDDAVKQFDKAYINFKSDFPDNAQQWEALIDGEVTYHSPEVISIVISTYLDTGGAHGNTNVKFFNFDSQTGKLFSKKELITNIDGLSKLVQSRLKDEIEANADNEPLEDLFFGKDFQLPESFGYSDEGLIILYNPYEMASYAQGIVEFTIPFEDVSAFLNIN